MRILRNGIWILLVVPAIALHCGQRGALTPEDAFHALRRAYNRADAPAMVRLLSQASLAKVNNAIGMFNRMNDEQREIIAERLSINPVMLRNLSPEGYCALQFKLGRQSDTDSIHEAASLEIIGAQVKGTKAVIRVENGMELLFVKEGPYWKFDTTGL